jgi:hypothetical protein
MSLRDHGKTRNGLDSLIDGMCLCSEKGRVLLKCLQWIPTTNGAVENTNAPKKLSLDRKCYSRGSIWCPGATSLRGRNCDRIESS